MDLIYGPVKSLRYGTTLGINLLGTSKVCSYNCVYCDLGLTTLTMNRIRKEYIFPTLEQIQESLRTQLHKHADYTTVVLSGNGEPTLHPQFFEMVQLLIEILGTMSPQARLIALTNGAHLESKKVVAGLNLLHERVVKLDAGNDALFAKVNDPLIRINMAKFLSHLGKLQDCTVQSLFFDGPINNISNEAVDDWIEVIGMIKPKAVQLCTVTRPSPANRAQAVSEDVLYGIAFKLKKRTSLESQVFAVQQS